MEKLESSYNTLSNGIIKPLFAYISCKVERCAQVLQNEIMGDGRIRNSSSTKASAIESGKTMAATSEPTPSPMNTCNNIESNNDESTVYSAQVRDAVKCPIKPTLVFRINSSCSITSMEVMNLEWNADGTSLCIVQRRKGFSSSSGTVLNANVRDKKKKANTLNRPISTGQEGWMDDKNHDEKYGGTKCICNRIGNPVKLQCVDCKPPWNEEEYFNGEQRVQQYF